MHVDMWIINMIGLKSYNIWLDKYRLMLANYILNVERILNDGKISTNLISTLIAVVVSWYWPFFQLDINNFL